MANMGAPEIGALFGSPTTPVPPTPEMPQRDALAEAGFYSPGTQRAEEKARVEREFAELAGGTNALGPREFGAFATQSWGLDARLASAAFHACDVDGSGALNRHEYLLLWAALVQFDPARDNACLPLVELRYRAAFLRYHAGIKVGASPPAAELDSLELDAAERREMVRDLCAGQCHVDAVLKALAWPDDDSRGKMSFAQFKSAVDSHQLAAHGLHLRDLLRFPSTHGGEPPRLVIDPKAVASRAPGSEIATPARPGEQSAHVSVPLGPAAVNEAREPTSPPTLLSPRRAWRRAPADCAGARSRPLAARARRPRLARPSRRSGRHTALRPRVSRRRCRPIARCPHRPRGRRHARRHVDGRRRGALGAPRHEFAE